MESQIYIEEMKKIQDILIDFIDNESVIDENFKIIIDQLNKHLIGQDHHKLRTFFGMLVNISNNHHHCSIFFEKVEKILFNFKSEIKKYFSNSELFKIFKSNRRILLYLFDEKMDDDIISKIIKYRYHIYFAPELQTRIESVKKCIRFSYNDTTVKDIQKKLPENFYENRKKGENESYICELIRTDSIEDFISYVNQNNYSLESYINPSIYETNPFLLRKTKKNLILAKQKEP